MQGVGGSRASGRSAEAESPLSPTSLRDELANREGCHAVAILNEVKDAKADTRASIGPGVSKPALHSVIDTKHWLLNAISRQAPAVSSHVGTSEATDSGSKRDSVSAGHH